MSGTLAGLALRNAPKTSAAWRSTGGIDTKGENWMSEDMDGEIGG